MPPTPHERQRIGITPLMQVSELWLIQAAAFKALADEKHGRLKTHSLHGEMVFNLSGSRHVSILTPAALAP